MNAQLGEGVNLLEMYRESEQRKSVLDGVLPTDGWKVESSVERKLRKTGEWIVDRTERRPASAGNDSSPGPSIILVHLYVPENLFSEKSCVTILKDS